MQPFLASSEQHSKRLVCFLPPTTLFLQTETEILKTEDSLLKVLFCSVGSIILNPAHFSISLMRSMRMHYAETLDEASKLFLNRGLLKHREANLQVLCICLEINLLHLADT